MANTIQWRDLFVVVDDGSVTIAEYQRIEPSVRNQAKTFPGGLGCLVIVPETAKPPPSSVRRHLEAMLARLPMRALAYLVEGTGFRAATVRAALISLGIFNSAKYATKVFTSLDEALKWLLSGNSAGDVQVAIQVISETRAQTAPRTPAEPSSSRRIVR